MEDMEKEHEEIFDVLDSGGVEDVDGDEGE